MRDETLPDDYYKEAAFCSIGFYNYHRWATDPRDFVTNAVADRLRASGTFTQVKPYDGRADIDYVLSGRLEKPEEIDYDGGVKVEVAISASMVRLSTGATVWTNSVSEVGQVDKRDVPAMVSEMSRTMDGQSKNYLMDLSFEANLSKESRIPREQLAEAGSIEPCGALAMQTEVMRRREL